MVSRSSLISFAERNYALALEITENNNIAFQEAKRIHPGEKWSNINQWREAVKATAEQMIRVAKKVVNGGKGAIYIVQVRRNDSDPTLITLTAGCDLLDPSEAGYIPLFTSDDYAVETEAD